MRREKVKPQVAITNHQKPRVKEALSAANMTLELISIPPILDIMSSMSEDLCPILNPNMMGLFLIS